LETLDDHPLEPISEHRLDRFLEAVRDLQEIGHRADHAAQLAGAVAREHGPDAGTIALALPLESLQRVQGGLPRRQLHTQAGQAFLRLGASRLVLTSARGGLRELDHYEGE